MPNFIRRFQYPIRTEPIQQFDPAKIEYPQWSEPVRRRINPALAVALIVSGLTAPLPIFDPAKLEYPQWSEPVRQKPGLRSAQQQSFAYGYFTPAAETVTEDKWHFAWSEPVRQKSGLHSSRQQAFIDGTTVPASQVGTGPDIVETLSSQVFYKKRFIYQSKAEPYFFQAAEVVTVDKWFKAWQDPVRQKPGLHSSRQQAFIDGTTVPAQVGTGPDIIETISSQVFYKKRFIYQSKAESYFFQAAEIVTVDKWYKAWQDPIRTRRFSPALQDVVADVPFSLIPLYQTEYPWSEPVRFRRLQTAQIDPYTAPEFIEQNAGRWYQAWSEPVRFRRFHPSLQDFSAYLDQNPDDSTFESKWHQAWSEPVRFRRFAVAEQQAIAYAPFFVSEVIYEDKWHFPWSEPVRQKPGLRAYLQDVSAYLDQNPDDSTFESKWHQAWSEPVRFRRFAAAQQQAFAFGAPSFEVVTIDKWNYPWSEPVRQKPGLKSYLQDVSAYLDQNPDQNLLSKWFTAWSEPVRFRRFQTARQQAFAFGAPAFINNGWFAPLAEPVRFRRFPAAEQRAFTAPEFTEQNVARWFAPWTEPQRRRLFASAQQQAVTQVYFTAEVINYDKWGYAWSEPVRFRRLPVALEAPELAFIAPQPAAAVDQPIIQSISSQVFYRKRLIYQTRAEALPQPVFVSSWLRPFDEPKRFRRGLPAWQQQAVAQAPIFPNLQRTIQWLKPFDEPRRFKRGLGSWLQQVVAEPPVFPNLQRTIPWLKPFDEPVRFKKGLASYYQQFSAFGQPTAANPFTVLIQGTEVNTDTIQLVLSVITALPADCVVSIKEIKAQAVSSIEEEPVQDGAVISIKEVKQADVISVAQEPADPAAVSIKEDD